VSRALLVGVPDGEEEEREGEVQGEGTVLRTAAAKNSGSCSAMRVWSVNGM